MDKIMKKRVNWIDLFKAFAIIAVIIDSTYYYDLFKNPIIQYFSSFSVTLFIFMAGITSALSISKRKNIDAKYFYSRLLTILIPYTIATLIYHLINHNGSFSLPIFFTSLITFSASPQFYFVVFYIQLVLVSGILYSLLNHRPGWFQVLILILIGFCTIYLNNNTMLLDIYGGGAKLLGGSYFFVFAMGMAFILNIDYLNQNKSLIWMFVLSSLLFVGFLQSKYYMVMFSNPPNVYLILFSFSLFGIICPIYRIVERFTFIQKIEIPILLIGRYSLYIFLYHLLFLNFGKIIATSLGFEHVKLLYRIWMLFMAVFPPILVGLLFEKVIPKFSGKGLNKSIEFVASVVGQEKVVQEEKIELNISSFFIKTFVLFLGWLSYLLAYWPGQASPDTIGQWDQIINGQFNDWHPAFHTMVMWLITRLWLSPAAIIIAQILFAAIVVGWTLSIIEKKGVPKNYIWGIIAFMVISPIFGLMLITPWKDIPYSISVTLLTTLIFIVVSSGGDWLGRTKNWVSLGIVGSLVMLFRYNGVPVGIVSLLSIYLISKKRIKQVVLSLLLCIIVWSGIRYPLSNLVGVTKLGNPGIEFALIQLIGRHVIEKTPLSIEEEIKINSLLPLEEYTKYNCDFQNPIVFNPQLNLKALSNEELFKISLDLTLRYPRVTLNHFRCTSAYIFSINNPTKSSPGYYYEYPTPEQNQYVYRADNWTPNFISSIMDSLVKVSVIPSLDWLVWRSAFWLYFFLVSLLFFVVVYNKWKYILVSLPLLMNMIPLIFLSSGQGVRYVFSTFLISLLFGSYFLYSAIKGINLNLRLAKNKDKNRGV